MSRPDEVARIGKSNLALARGEEDVREWSDEELLRGRKRAKDGSFKGRSPMWMHRTLYQEVCQRALREWMPEVVETLKAGVLGEAGSPAEAKVRLDYARTILAFTVGEPVQQVTLDARSEVTHRTEVGPALQQVAANVLARLSGQEQEPTSESEVLEAEVIEPAPSDEAERETDPLDVEVIEPHDLECMCPACIAADAEEVW